jgi:xylulokinase
MSLLGVDVGSGSCKAVVFSDDGAILGQASHGYRMAAPAPGRAEMDAEVLWTAFAETVREVASNTGSPITALAIASHGETVIPVDGHGLAVGPAIMNADNRATQEAQGLEAAIGRAEIYRITGVPPHPMFALNKILWLRAHAPEVWNRAKRFLSVEDYLLGRLGLPPFTAYSLACRTMAFDLHRLDWSAEILAAAGLRKEQLGMPAPSGRKIGVLSAGVATPLGLRPGTVVATGGHDQPCGALGAGVTQPGQVADSAGTYECLAAVTDAPRNTIEALKYALNSYCHVVPGQYVTLAFFPAGLVAQWFVDQLCGEDLAEARRTGGTLYDVLDEAVARRCTGPTGLCLTPHFVGACNPHWDPSATGALVGLTPGLTRHHLYKAVYEGIACELAINMDVLETIVGTIGPVRLHGGNARSAFTVQLRADLTGRTMEHLTTAEAVCRGAALLAGVGAGVFTDVHAAAAQWSSTQRVFTPDQIARQRYEPQAQRYRRLYPALAAAGAFPEARR